LDENEPPEPRSTRFEVAGKADLQDVALSPDGRYLAFTASNSLWVRPLDSLEARALGGTEDAKFPFWSPDSASLGFLAAGKLKRIAAGGGPVQTLCDAPNNRGGTWNRDGVILFAPDITGGLYRVSAAGGPGSCNETGECCLTPLPGDAHGPEHSATVAGSCGAARARTSTRHVLRNQVALLT